MSTVFVQLNRFNPFNQAVTATGQNAAGVPRDLMERAGANAGRDPRQSQELREAAQAYLRVVR
jgi:hypothetical protein